MSDKHKFKRIHGLLALFVIGIFIIVTTTIAIGDKTATTKSPIPANINDQLNFSILYPKDESVLNVNKQSIAYRSADKILTFSGTANNTKVIVTEQKASGNSTKPTVAYYQSLGLNPAVQIQTNKGLAILMNFKQPGSNTIINQGAVFAVSGTLMLAQADKNLSKENWKNIFDNLSVYNQ